MHAFLEAYFNTEMDEATKKNNFLDYGYLPARAGSLQAALNIEVQDLDIGMPKTSEDSYLCKQFSSNH